jgi:hypothetical protein
MAIHGTLTTMSLSDLLQFLAAGRKTGTLKLDRGDVAKKIYYERGLIVGSNSNDPNEYFGQALISFGKLTEEQLQAAMEVQRTSGGRLGEILVSTNVVSQADVLEILKTRTLEIIYDLFLWEDAHFEFYDNEPLPDDLIRIEVQPTAVIMDGVYRLDEWARYRAVFPSDRVLLELGTGWTSSLNASKEVRQLLYLIEKRMSVAEICYNMHDSSFHVYGQLYELVAKGIARIAGEVPEAPAARNGDRSPSGIVETIPELLRSAESRLDGNDVSSALVILQKIILQEPKNASAQRMLQLAEQRFVEEVYTAEFFPHSVPKLLVPVDDLSGRQLAPQEGFILSRINGEWDVKSILSVCPFREADSLRMIKSLRDGGIIGF